MHLRGILLVGLAHLITLASCITISLAATTLSQPRSSSSSYLAPAATTIPAPHSHPPPTKRTTPHHLVTLNGLTLRASRPLALLLPVQLAASAFEAFYATLYRAAVAELAGGTSGAAGGGGGGGGVGARSFTLRHSVFEISFVTSDVEVQLVPWAFVRDFAVMMRLMSLRGYTGFYDQGYWDEVGGLGVFVGLRVLGELV